MYLFVYGTLQSGQINHYYLKDARFIDKARSIPLFQIIQREYDSYRYPAAFLSQEPDAQPLKGEIYEIDENTLKTIDELEDYPHEYDRKIMDFTLQDGQPIKALIYIGVLT